MGNNVFPSFLEDAFTNGYAATDSDKDKFVFSTVNIGKLNVKEGKIYACDPISLYIEDVFTTEFPKGQFPVELAIATINNDDERTGFARIKFAETKPVKWEYALCEGQDVAELEADEIFGYGVDSGTGSFMDESGYREYDDLYKVDVGLNTITEAMELSYKDTRSWLLWERNGNNVALFTTGYGDGLYASYIGYDSAGNICRLVTDFGLLDWEYETYL